MSRKKINTVENWNNELVPILDIVNSVSSVKYSVTSSSSLIPIVNNTTNLIRLAVIWWTVLYKLWSAVSESDFDNVLTEWIHDLSTASLQDDAELYFISPGWTVIIYKVEYFLN